MSYEHCKRHDRDATNGCRGCEEESAMANGPLNNEDFRRLRKLAHDYAGSSGALVERLVHEVLAARSQISLLVDRERDAVDRERDAAIAVMAMRAVDESRRAADNDRREWTLASPQPATEKIHETAICAACGHAASRHRQGAVSIGCLDCPAARCSGSPMRRALPDHDGRVAVIESRIDALRKQGDMLVARLMETEARLDGRLVEVATDCERLDAVVERSAGPAGWAAAIGRLDDRLVALENGRLDDAAHGPPMTGSGGCPSTCCSPHTSAIVRCALGGGYEQHDRHRCNERVASGFVVLTWPTGAIVAATE